MKTSRLILDPDSLPADGRGWTTALIGMLAALLVFMPAAFGAVEAWSELVVLTGAAAMSICLALRPIFDRSFRPVRTWLYLPLVLFAALVALQLLPLPTELVRWLSPTAVSVRQELLSDAGPPDRLTTLSIYPFATAHQLRLLLVGLTVFAVAATVLRTSREIKTVLSIVFAVGFAEAALALAQIASLTSHFYWAVPSGSAGVVTSGTFVNYSNFSQFMNLSLGAGIALLLVLLDEDRRAEIRGDTGWGSFAGVNWEKRGWLLCGLVVCGLSILMSMSRNGAISMMVAAVVLSAALYGRGSLSWRGWLMGLVPLSVVAVLLVAGFDALYERLATLQHASSFEGRWEMTAGTLRAWWAYPLWGAGLGTHEFVFPMFDTAVTPVVAAHADNDYAQLLEETGILGAILVAAFLAGVGRLAWRQMFRGRTPVANAAFGLVFGLVAVAIHSASDFGQHLPANFALSALFCGLLVAIARIEGRARRKRSTLESARPTSSPWLRPTAAGAALVALLAVWAWALRDGYAAYLGEQWSSAASTIETQIQRATAPADDQQFVDLIAAAENAFQSEPRNVKYGYWLNVYRWQSLNRAAVSGEQEVTLHPAVLPFVERIADALTDVRRLCPTYGPPFAVEGELRLLVLSDPRGAELIRRAVRLAPYDPPTCLVAGQLAARSGQVDEAVSLLSRAVALQPSFYGEAIGIYLFELRRPDLARSLAGDDYGRLQTLARMCAESDEYTDLADDLFAAAEATLRSRATEAETRANDLAILANIDFNRGDFESAVELYRRALAQEYRQVDWRLRLAHTLVALDRHEEALREVRICLRLRPHYPPATKLLEHLGDHDTR